jgi:hypothetical protein
MRCVTNVSPALKTEPEGWRAGESPEAALKELHSLVPATNYELANYERLTLSRSGEACCSEGSVLRRAGRGLPFLLLDKLAHWLMGR